MADINVGIQLRYDTFINRQYPLFFFVGLGDYMSYVMSIPRLTSVVNKQFAIRDAEYEKVQRLEDKAVDELREAKNKLLKIISNKKIDPKTFSQDLSYIPTSHLGSNINILQHLEMFEKGEVSISGHHSDNLERYLFDIAANLLKLGYKDELKDFIITPTEYAEYHDTINGQDSVIHVAGNARGNFSFSKTWPIRFEQERVLNAAREIEPWGAFEMLVKYWKARTQITKSKSMNHTMLDVLADKQYHFTNKDAVDIAFAVEDFREMQKNPRIDDREIHFLHLEQFRSKTATAHWQLSQATEDHKEMEHESGSKGRTVALQNLIEKTWKQNVETFMEETRGFMEEYRAAKEEEEHFEQGEKWWKSGERPAYDPSSKTISLGEKISVISPTVKNQQVLCKALFSKPIGEWLQHYEINPPLKTKQGQRGFYYIGRGLNRKTSQDLSVEMFEVGMFRIRIKKELFP